MRLNTGCTKEGLRSQPQGPVTVEGFRDYNRCGAGNWMRAELRDVGDVTEVAAQITSFSVLHRAPQQRPCLAGALLRADSNHSKKKPEQPLAVQAGVTECVNPRELC